MADFARDQGQQAPAEVVAAWQAVTGAWSDVEAHDRFVRAVAAAMSYPWAAQRYRDALRLRPDDRLAAEQLARLARMAEATLFASGTRKAPEAARPYRGAIALLVVMLVLIVVGVGAAILGSSLKEEEARPPPGKAAPRPATPTLKTTR
jgi:hypothetical protein